MKHLVRGFSLILVTVVMIVMLVFGLLSVSSAGADYRLSTRASESQKIYYDLDASGEDTMAFCSDACEKAWAASLKDTNSQPDLVQFKSHLDSELKAGEAAKHFKYKMNDSSVTVESSISSTINGNYSLQAALLCDWNKKTGKPAFKITRWQFTVSGPKINSNQTINVWDGK